MTDISKIKVGNIWYQIKDKIARAAMVPSGGSAGQVLKKATASDYDMEWGEGGSGSQNIYYVKGTQTAAGAAWTGVLDEVAALYEGLTIVYWLPFAGASNVTLNLTLKDGSTTGAVNCYYSGTTRLSTHIGVNNLLVLVYQTVTISNTSYTGWWLIKDYYVNDTAIYLYHNGNFVADSVIYRYQILFQRDANTVTPLNNVSNSTGTTKAMLTDVTFDPFGEILYWNSTTTINAGGNVTSTARYAFNIDVRYTFNCGSTLTAHRPLYLKVAMQSDGLVKLASASPLVQELPSSADGYYYIYLGRTYSAYQLGMTARHPVYYHDGTKIREYLNIGMESKADISDLGDLAYEDSIDYAGTKLTNKPTLGALAALSSIAYSSNYITGKPTLGSMAAVDDAASDGKQYARKNGAWAEVASSSGLPDGGTIGQVLVKNSDVDGDAGWYDIHKRPTDKWWLPTGIVEDQVIAAFQFIGRDSETDALYSIHEGSQYVLTTSGETVTWNSEVGFSRAGGNSHSLTFSGLSGIADSIVTVVYRFADADTGTEAFAIGGFAASDTKYLFIKGRKSTGGASGDYGTYYPSMYKYRTAERLASGILAADFVNNQMYVNGEKKAVTSIAALSNVPSNQIMSRNSTYSGSETWDKGYSMQAIVLYSTSLTESQHLELAEAMNAL